MAFNIIPQVGELENNGDTDAEGIIAGQVSRLLILPRTSFDITMMWSPVFFGDVVTVSLQCKDQVAMKSIVSQWQDNPLLVLSSDKVQTPVTNASGKSVINLGRVRSWQTDDETTHVTFCAITDPVQLSATMSLLVLKNQMLG